MNDEPRDGGLIDMEFIFKIFFIVLSIALCFVIFDKLANGDNKIYTIQDIEVWCCKNNSTISPTGQNCLDLNAIVCPEHNKEVLLKYGVD